MNRAATRASSAAEPNEAAYAQVLQSDLAWRYLLPTPAGGVFGHLVLLGGTPELTRAVLALEIAREVTTTLAPGVAADAVVCLSGAAEFLEDAVRCLGPNGVMYAETRAADAAAGESILTMRTSLGRAGLNVSATYWRIPPAGGRGAALIPVASPRAVRWYLTNLGQQSWKQRLIWRIPLMTKVAGRIIVRRQCQSYAVVAVAAAARLAAPAVLDAAGPRARAPARPDLLLLLPSNERAVFLLFGAEPQPLAALKIATFPARNDICATEQHALKQVRSQVDPAFARSIPEPLGTFRLGPSAGCAETGMRGGLLAREVPPRGVPRAVHVRRIQQVGAWVTSLQLQTGGSTIRWQEAPWASAITASAGAFADAFGRQPGDAALFDALELRSGTLAKSKLPVVWSQGDLHSGNIFVDQGRLSVVDWGSAAPGLPLLDLIKFVTHWNSHVRRTGEAALARDFERLFTGESPDALETAARAALVAHGTALGVDHRFIHLLTALLWVDLAVHSARRAADPHDAGVHERYARCYAEYVRVLARRAPAEFAWAGGSGAGQ